MAGKKQATSATPAAARRTTAAPAKAGNGNGRAAAPTRQPVNRAAAMFRQTQQPMTAQQTQQPVRQQAGAGADAWAKARQAARANINTGTTLPPGPAYEGQLVKAKLVDTDKGKKVIWTVRSVDPDGYGVKWDGPINTGDVDALGYFAQSLLIFNVDIDTIDPSQIDQEYLNQIVDSKPGVRFAVVPSQDGRFMNVYFNQPMDLPDDFLAGVDLTDMDNPGTQQQAGDEGAEILDVDDTAEQEMGVGSEVSYPGGGGITRTGTITTIQADGKVVITDHEDGKPRRVSGLDKCELLAAV